MFSFYVNLAPNQGALKDVSFFKNLSNFFDVKFKSKDYYSLDECKENVDKFLQAILDELNANPLNRFFVRYQENPHIQDYFAKNKEEDSEKIQEVGGLAKWSKNELIRFYLLNEDGSTINENDEVNYVTHLIIAITFLNNDQTKGN
jgi:hypothetical protein